MGGALPVQTFIFPRLLLHATDPTQPDRSTVPTYYYHRPTLLPAAAILLCRSARVSCLLPAVTQT